MFTGNKNIDWFSYVSLNLQYFCCHREFLASEGRKCAQKSLFGGGYDTLVECLEDDQIGFQGQCAICWADDILCTKSFCAFIGIQSFLINTLTNFAVGEDTITAAACEEAHCEGMYVCMIKASAKPDNTDPWLCLFLVGIIIQFLKRGIPGTLWLVLAQIDDG